jgi:enoyl-CoA hydratase/carnithine racemase
VVIGVAEVIVEVDVNVQTIRINQTARTQRPNAAVARRVADAIDQARSSTQIRVSVLTGDADAFSSGTDPRALADDETAEIDGRGLCGIAYEPPARR